MAAAQPNPSPLAGLTWQLVPTGPIVMPLHADTTSDARTPMTSSDAWLVPLRRVAHLWNRSAPGAKIRRVHGRARGMEHATLAIACYRSLH